MFRREEAHHRRCLGEAVALLHRNAARKIGLQHRKRAWRPADDKEANRRQVRLGKGWVLRHELEHRRHAEHRRDLVRGDVGQHASGIEASMQDDETAFLKRDQRRHIEPADMEHRRRCQRDVVGQAVDRVHAVDVVPPEIAMVSIAPFGRPVVPEV
jgi:hypothetical protein